jgi:hypothetical protein
MLRSRCVRGSTLVTISLALAGCGAPSEEDEITAVQQSIVNGTAVSTDAVGTPRFNNTMASETCSSTLLRDRWLITAYHCVTTTGGRWELPAPASSLTATVGTTTAAGAEVYYPGTPGSPADIDVALVKLAAALPAPSGHPEPWDLPLYSGSSSSLVGNTYYCQGWGYGSCSTQNIALRSANLQVSSADAAGYTLMPNAAGQIQTLGDSGSSCYQVVNGRYNVLGVHSAGECGVYARQVGADTIRDWVGATMDRVGSLDLTNGTLRLKEGGLNHAWVATYTGAFLASAAGPRVAMIRQSDQHCLVKEGAFLNSWVDMGFGGVVRCLVNGSRIGVLTQDGTFRVKDGSVSSSGFVTQDTFVASAVLSGNRIGVVKNGHFYVKEGGLSAGWVDVASNVAQGSLSGTRIGYRTTAGDFRVKDGSVSSTNFVTQSTNVTQGALSGNRIGVVKTDGHFYVREGAVSPVSGWVDQYANVQQGVLSGKRIGVVANDGTSASPVYRFRVKEGALSAGWVVQAESNSVGYIAVLPDK